MSLQLGQQQNFLSSEIGLESFSQKYFRGLSERYEDVTQDDINGAAEGMMQFLADIEAGENAVDLLHSFTYFRVYFEGPGRPRKIRPLFGSIEDPVKTREWSKDGAPKAFRAFVFGLRSNTVPNAPVGWLWKTKNPHQCLPNLR